MRDEDLKNLPQSIERWKFAEMLEALGLGRDAQNNLKGFVVSSDAVRAVVYATDESGHRMITREMDQIEVTELGQEEASFVEGDWRPVAATHEISIPFVGEWKRPADDRKAVASMNRCDSRPEGEYAELRCERQAGHGGQHVAWNGTDSDVRWGSNSGEPADVLHSYVFPCPADCRDRDRDVRHHHFRDESGTAWSHLTVPKEQEHTECLLPECPGPAVLSVVQPAEDPLP